MLINRTVLKYLIVVGLVCNFSVFANEDLGDPNSSIDCQADKGYVCLGSMAQGSESICNSLGHCNADKIEYHTYADQVNEGRFCVEYKDNSNPWRHSEFKVNDVSLGAKIDDGLFGFYYINATRVTFGELGHCPSYG